MTGIDNNKQELRGFVVGIKDSTIQMVGRHPTMTTIDGDPLRIYMNIEMRDPQGKLVPSSIIEKVIQRGEAIEIYARKASTEATFTGADYNRSAQTRQHDFIVQTDDRIRPLKLANGARVVDFVFDTDGAPTTFMNLITKAVNAGAFGNYLSVIGDPRGGLKVAFSEVAKKAANAVIVAGVALGPIGAAADAVAAAVDGHTMMDMADQALDNGHMTQEAYDTYLLVIGAHAVQVIVDQTGVAGEVLVQEAFDKWADLHNVDSELRDMLRPPSLMDSIFSQRAYTSAQGAFDNIYNMLPVEISDRASPEFTTLANAKQLIENATNHFNMLSRGGESPDPKYHGAAGYDRAQALADAENKLAAAEEHYESRLTELQEDPAMITQLIAEIIESYSPLRAEPNPNMTASTSNNQNQPSNPNYAGGPSPNTFG